jgi:hypothetical protein
LVNYDGKKFYNIEIRGGLNGFIAEAPLSVNRLPDVRQTKEENRIEPVERET